MVSNAKQYYPKMCVGVYIPIRGGGGGKIWTDKIRVLNVMQQCCARKPKLPLPSRAAAGPVAQDRGETLWGDMSLPCAKISRNTPKI